MKKNGKLMSSIYCNVDISDIVKAIENSIVQNVKNFISEGCLDNMVW